MGKEWLYRGSGGGKRGRLEDRGRFGGGGERESSSPSGCMSAVFQLFDFNQFHQFPLHHQVPNSFLPEESTILKGIEAPRNSLEMDGPFMEAASFPASMKLEEQTLNIPMGIQIQTSRPKVGAPKARTDQDLSSECSSSPGSKTPNLVARLMGLDLLPDTCSTPSNPALKPDCRRQRLNLLRSSSGRSILDTDIIGTRSLPETPRISSARRSDVDHHRLSLQINKENNGSNKDSEFRMVMKTVRQEDESGRSSPGHYARQIVKQVRENIGRKVGADITNTMRNREQRRDDHLLPLKPKKPSKGLVRDKSTPSCSPRLRFLELKNKQVDNNNNYNNQPQSGKVPLKTKSKATVQEKEHHQKNLNQKCKKIACERYGPRLKGPPNTSDVFRNKQEEPFVRSPATNRARLDKKCKNTPLSSELLNVNIPTLFPVKKEPPSPAAKLPQKQSQVSASISRKRIAQLPSCTYRQEATHTSTAQGTTTTGATEFQYVTRILKRSGIDKNTPVSFARWYSPAHPLHPSIFHLLELCFPTTTTTTTAKDSQLSHRCNRKLIFHLVDETLVEILRPYMNLKPWVCSFSYDCPMSGSQLIDTICTKIRSFPSADCRVLKDIDALIEKDLSVSKMRRPMALEEEGEAIVAELESDLVDSLVHEMAFGVLFGV
ncbi:uncharacterized protein LOC130763840 isoform X1 [Actinidia eriantha]|uniref:uncharacterized protein LOC130763840 isoform X1 n=1 Tax=Actinidia eriantha TaxID=165200 RepID=UPI00258CA814|nr:uncharacterized protein LOC130763840 isoform X1 [Actinidia eriantha]